MAALQAALKIQCESGVAWPGQGGVGLREMKTGPSGKALAPVLILHGEQDAVIPVEMGLRVYRAANELKRIELFAEGSHDDLFDHGAWKETRAFVDSLGSSAK